LILSVPMPVMMLSRLIIIVARATAGKHQGEQDQNEFAFGQAA